MELIFLFLIPILTGWFTFWASRKLYEIGRQHSGRLWRYFVLDAVERLKNEYVRLYKRTDSFAYINCAYHLHMFSLGMYNVNTENPIHPVQDSQQEDIKMSPEDEELVAMWSKRVEEMRYAAQQEANKSK